LADADPRQSRGRAQPADARRPMEPRWSGWEQMRTAARDAGGWRVPGH
jgi:hypothetical protein